MLTPRSGSRALQLLYGPRIAVRVLEEEEARTGRTLGSELLHVADADAAAGELLVDGVDVLDDELHALDRPGLAKGQPLAELLRAG